MFEFSFPIFFNSDLNGNLSRWRTSAKGQCIFRESFTLGEMKLFEAISAKFIFLLLETKKITWWAINVFSYSKFIMYQQEFSLVGNCFMMMAVVALLVKHTSVLRA